MISVSGVRGIYGDGLDDAIAERFAYSFGQLYPGCVVVGRDSRVSGAAIAGAVVSGLRKAGVAVIDLGLASTPTTELAVTVQDASGGVIITASHNPGEWNGLKFLGPDGVFLDSAEGTALLEEFRNNENVDSLQAKGELTTWDGANEYHLDEILNLDIIDPDLIAGKRFQVALDTVNGAGGPICTALLERLGCTIHGINLDPTGRFAHTPEPVPDHLHDLEALVRTTGAAIGFAVDPDVDRLSLVSNEAVAIGEEYTLAIAAEYIFGKLPGDGACNLSTSRMIDDAADRHGRTVHRSKVGEINVVDLMRETGAVIGGEGNGGVILPALHHGRDAVLGIALILQIMAERDMKLSELAAEFPHYTMIKEKQPVGERGAWREPVKNLMPGTGMDERDGIKIILPDSWVHVRESNTEPVVRIIAEAPSDNAARGLIESVRKAIG